MRIQKLALVLRAAYLSPARQALFRPLRSSILRLALPKRPAFLDLLKKGDEKPEKEEQQPPREEEKSPASL